LFPEISEISGHKAYSFKSSQSSKGERFWQSQKRFGSLNEFIDWYNLIWRALWIEIGETPKNAR